MALTIKHRVNGNVEVIDLAGQLTLGEGTSALRDAYQKALDRKSHILLNLAGVSYIDSAGLGQLVDGYSRAAAQGHAVKLLKPHTRVDTLLHVTRLNSTFETFEDEVAALASFGA